MSLYPTLQADFSKKYLDLTLCLNKFKTCDSSSIGDLFCKILIAQKKMENSYQAMDKRAVERPLQEAYDLGMNKAQKSLHKILQEEGEKPLIGLANLAVTQKYAFFGDVNSHPDLACLTLDFPCSFEFGGLCFPSAMHAFIAQMFPDRPDLRQKCSQVPKEELFPLILENGNQCPGWYQPDSEQYRVKTMFHIQNAKFGQNPSLKKALLATIHAPLIYTTEVQNMEGFWGLDPQGTWPNHLGRILMQIRGEYGGCSETDIDEACIKALSELPYQTQLASLDKSNDRIESEYNSLDTLFNEADYKNRTKQCRKPENNAKNRYHGSVNQVFDQTLVPLSTGRYINANYLYSKLLIATQSPLPQSTEDFWQMVLDQKCQAIVMLNRPSDCNDYFYFPTVRNPSLSFGSMQIKCLEGNGTQTDPSWKQGPNHEEPHAIKKRHLEITKNGRTHRVMHYQYINWLDHKLGSEGCLGKLVMDVAENQGKNTAPIVIHCLAGIGRTGVFAAVYHQYLQWLQGNEFDIAASVAEQRASHTGRYYKMIPSSQQYALCYKTLRHILNGSNVSSPDSSPSER